MSTSKRPPRLYAIGLHRPFTRRLLKLLVLPLPIYLLYLALPLELPLDWRYYMLYKVLPWLYAGLCIALVSKKLYVSNNHFRFALGPQYDSANLLEVDTTGSDSKADKVVLLFKKGERVKQETISLSNLKIENRLRLLRAIEQNAPHAKISTSARNALNNQFANKILTLSGRTHLVYDTRPLLGQFVQMLAGYQNYFWLAWICTCSLLVGFAYFMLRMQHYTDNPLGHQIRTITGPLISAFFKMLLSTGDVAVAGATHANGLLGLIAITILGAVALPYCLGANRLTITDNGLSLELAAMGLKKQLGQIKWSEIDKINLSQKTGSRDKQQNLVKIESASGHSFSIDLQALGSSSQRGVLAQAIEKYAPHVAIDSNAIAMLRPPTESSFTDIWLSGITRAPHSEALVPLVAGDTIKDGHYKIIDRFMLGGQSTVYLASYSNGSDAENLDLKNVDLKSVNLIVKESILPTFNDIDKNLAQYAKYKAEADFLANLNHPGLVKVIDSFVEGSRGFLVMERVHGESLKSLVQKNGYFSEEAVRDFALQMCEILGYLHGQKVIHRDFTPDNLMLDDHGKIKLIDFGVAQNTTEHVTSAVVGKHAYMPPEQFRGQATERSDLYAMGATLFYLLSANEPTPLSKLQLDTTIGGNVVLRSKLAELISSLTEFEEQKRPESASEVGRALLQVIELG